MLIDLQLHSTYSDGYLSPTEVAEFSFKNGVKVAALTDHNTVGGVHEFKKACKRLKIKPITGLELYVKLGSKKFNLLWYNFDETDPELHNMLRDSQRRRRRLFRAALERLVNNGFIIDVDNILDKYNHYVPLNHVVDDLLRERKNVVKMKKELKIKEVQEGDVINNYLRGTKTGKLRNSFLNVKRILRLHKRIGGTLVLCHPSKHGYLNEAFLKKIKKMGIEGIEKLSPHHSFGAVMYIQYLAREYGFIETGGSDFHRHEGSSQLVQNSWEYYKIDSDKLREIETVIS